jgi:hypothetical protein
LPIVPTPCDITLNIPQLRLLHHYSNITGPSLAADSEAGEVWAVAVVQAALDYPYLLHVVLALAALHMGRLERASDSKALDLMILAGRHYDAALGTFQTTVCDINDSNYQPVLMFAALLFPYSCAASVNTGHATEHVMDSLLSNFALTRRVRPMVAGFYQAMKESEMRKMIPKDIDGIDWTTQEPPIETELVQLRKFSGVVHHLYPPDIVDAYGYAIHILELTFAASAKSENPASDALLKIWIHFVSDRYLELLSERQPGSLIIYAHYAVLLQRSSEQYWYLKGVAEQILHVADSLVPTEWKAWLAWPKEQIYGVHDLAMPD